MRTRFVHKKFILWVILLFALTGMNRGQISSNAADSRDSLSYVNSPGKDPLFVFFQTNRVYKAGSLTATLPGSEHYNFEWSRYNPGIPGFDEPFSSVSEVPSSTVTGLQEGGYRVRIFNGGGTDTTLMAWVMLDDFRAEVVKNEEGALEKYMYACAFVSVSGLVYPDTLVYYDPVFHDTISRLIQFRFRWTSDNTGLRIPNDSTVLYSNKSYLPPYEDTWYILTATDDLGMVEVDSVFYKSIQTRAEFTVEYYDKVTGEWDPDLSGQWSKDKGSTDAKLTVRFINESENGTMFEWVFLDTLGGIRETATTYDLEERPEFTYETADKYYYPYLVSTSEEGCEDSVSMEQGIYVEPSDLAIPNVFSPNGDGKNDIFEFKHQSLRWCRITIVDRTGKVVYKKEIDDIYQWEGWNGNVKGSDRRAPEGQYYYIVEALGYDGEQYKDPSIWEDFSLFNRNKNKSTTGTGGTGGTPPGGTQDGEQGNLYTGWLYLFRH